jgi:hypothetical protein
MNRKSKPTKKPTIITIQENIVSPWTPRCPVCGTEITAQAAVDEFKPDGWVSFWGYDGARWKKCGGEQGGRPFVHFYVELNGRASHRLAWLPMPEENPAEQTTLFDEAGL